MAFAIRPAVAGDSPGITVLLDQLGYPADADDVATRVAHWLDEPNSALLVATADGDEADAGAGVGAGVVAGVAALHALLMLDRSGRRGRLVALVVDDAVRGQGIGRALLEAAERSARDLGCRDMEITSSRRRVAAHAFYTRLGYADICDRSARFVKDL
ncbi:GNAT family N-acetyltransferase [Actinomadura sp. 9N215]|uniref:GNAT family N-acetyltransferase n=1 Tax=Actinomadura sp. 9N215 TaxID=3375150 RepID=UPI003794241D